VNYAYGENVMNEGNVRQWRRMFKDWLTNEQILMMKSRVVGKLSAVSSCLKH
jgi:hypothetical protein